MIPPYELTVQYSNASRVSPPRPPHTYCTVYSASADKLKGEAELVRQRLEKERASVAASQAEAAKARALQEQERASAREKLSEVKAELERERKVSTAGGRLRGGGGAHRASGMWPWVWRHGWASSIYPIILYLSTDRWVGRFAVVWRSEVLNVLLVYSSVAVVCSVVESGGLLGLSCMHLRLPFFFVRFCWPHADGCARSLDLERVRARG